MCTGVHRRVFSLLAPDFLGLDWSLQDPSAPPPALKNTFHFNVAAAHEVVCHLIMTKQTQRPSAVKCAYKKKRRWGGPRRPCGLDWTFKMEPGSPTTDTWRLTPRWWWWTILARMFLGLAHKYYSKYYILTPHFSMTYVRILQKERFIFGVCNLRAVSNSSGS